MAQLPTGAEDVLLGDGRDLARVGNLPRVEAPPNYLERNLETWERRALDSFGRGHEALQRSGLYWGVWETPEARLQLLSRLAPQADIIELGCGAGTLCAAFAREGHRPVGVDFSPNHIEAARRLQHEFGVVFPLVCANAEEVPFDGESFDAVVSEYGASLWCDPRRWLPEASRLLVSGGRLIFFTNAAMLMACTPADGSEAENILLRAYFTPYEVEFPGENALEFHPTHGHWIRLLRLSGFVVEDMLEVRPLRRSKPRFNLASVEWARRWPSEEIWIARKA